MYFNRLSLLAVMALVAISITEVSAVPANRRNEARPRQARSHRWLYRNTIGRLTRGRNRTPPLTTGQILMQQQREDTTQRGKALEAQQGIVAQATTTFTQVDGICPVCQNEAQDGEAVFVSDCGHFLHVDCLNETPTDDRKKCPVCRAARTQGSVDKLGESLHFVPAEEGGVPAVTKRFAGFLSKIVASPKDMCDNDPSPTDGWSCFRDDGKKDGEKDGEKIGKKIYATEAVLDAVVKSITGATRTGCASKPDDAPDAPATDGQEAAAATDDLFSTVTLPKGADWGEINVQVQCIDQKSPQGLVNVAGHSLVVVEGGDPEDEDEDDDEEEEEEVVSSNYDFFSGAEEAREQHRQLLALEQATGAAQAEIPSRTFRGSAEEWTSVAMTLLDNPRAGAIVGIDNTYGVIAPNTYYPIDEEFNNFWRRRYQFFPAAEYSVTKFDGPIFRRSALDGRELRVTITRIADNRTAFLSFRVGSGVPHPGWL